MATNINIINKVKKSLLRELPSYSIPKKILFFKDFPKNLNNKLDLKKLNLLASK